MGARGGRLRAGRRRRPGGGRPPVRGVVGGRERRRGRPPLRPALSPHRGLPRAPRAARAAPPQHHPARVLRRLGRRHGPDLPGGPGGARDPGRALRPGARGQRVQPAGARGPRGRAHRGPAHLPRLRPLPRGAEPGPAPAARGRPHQPALRRAARPEQEARGPRPPRELLEALRLPRRAPRARGEAPAPAGLLRRAAGARLRGGLHPRGGGLHRPRRARRPPRLLRGGAGLRVDERARGLRRAARRVDADARPGAGPRGDRGPLHAGRRRRAVRREAHRGGGGDREGPGHRRGLRERVLLGQDRRLAAFAPEAVKGALRAHLESL